MPSLRLSTPYVGPDATLRSRAPLGADLLVLVSVALIFYLIVLLSYRINAPIQDVASPSTLSTNPALLPYYAGRSLLRMFAALVASLVFTAGYATLAARSRRAEKILIPLLDILQSVPVLGFLSVTLSFWLWLFPGSELGVELASIFAIFTAQVWNLTFAFYQSLLTLPRDLDEVSRLLRLTKWQRFWRIDVPHGTMPLVWNGIMSFGGGWFFLIASEAISVNNQDYALPGIGSYVAAVSHNQEIGLLLLAIGVMVVMVIGVNFVFWRPLTAWSERFRLGDTAGAVQQKSYVYDLLRRSRVPSLLGRAGRPVGRALDRLSRPFGLAERTRQPTEVRQRTGDAVFTACVAIVIGFGLFHMLTYLHRSVGLGEFGTAAWLGLLTFLRVIVLLAFASLIWVPVGVWIGLNPRVTRFAQPIVQVLASFPANFLFPFVTMALIVTGISLDIGGILLMALGAQWYILFNVIAGASAIPHDLIQVAANLRLGRLQRWRTLYLPAIFGAWVTGGITAAGGAWNASIVAEVVSYGDTTLMASGLGAYISESTAHGDFGRTLIGVVVMSLFVVGLNRVFWKPLYNLAERRYSFN
ncbi:MAG: ABC transporter permease subunit [Promicromonosporaceae bacterium]|nr:ABC transporter permease subunit [Promicromonosporaceae bacterium]